MNAEIGAYHTVSVSSSKGFIKFAWRICKCSVLRVALRCAYCEGMPPGWSQTGTAPLDFFFSYLPGLQRL